MSATWRRVVRGLIAAALAVSVAAPAASAGPAVTPLVSTAWLEDNLGADGLVVLDIRGRTFETGHVPGSVRSDYPGRWRATIDGVPWSMPPVPDLEATIGALGIGPDSSVVIVPAGTDATELGGATWIYFVFKYLGHDAVAILDGSWAAWVEEARPVATDAAAPVAASFTASLRPEILVATADVAARVGTDTVLIDARSPAQYRGEETSQLVLRPGHIPGAVNFDNALTFDAATHRLLPPDAIRALLPAAARDPATPAIVYCNSGHWSSIVWFVLHELLGYADMRLYAGSMAAWSRIPELPVETGE
ncbi:MAG: sulfurtransferase [Bauldia sp.]|nr:sulfurtransferase [Bauldia sp.]